MPSRSQPLLADVAKHAGVSTMTVSRVLNGSDTVSTKTRARVLEAIEQVGYVPNMLARSLASGRSRLIGLVVWELTSSYFTEIVRGVCQEADASGFHTVLHTSGPNQDRELSLVSSMLGGLVDGLLLVLPRNGERYVELLQKEQLPCVLIDNRSLHADLPTVQATNEAGAFAATQHLIELGHRRIACITGNMQFGCGLQRLDGYRRALEEAGIPFDPALVRHGDFSQPAGYVCAQELLALSPRPTAIFASSDPMAMGVYTAAYEAGLSIPDQLSVVGFNDTPEVLQMRPQLTTVHQPIFEMGGEAVRLLQQLLDAPAAATPIVELPTHLVVRQSTAAPGHAA